MTSETKRATTFVAAAVLAACVVATLKGCNLASLVAVDVPPGVREALAVPEGEAVTLADAGDVWALWNQWCERESIRLAREIGNAQERYDVLSGLTSMGLQALEGQAAGIPFGPFLLAGLGGLGGLFLKRPGDKKREQLREVAAYRAGAVRAGAADLGE